MNKALSYMMIGALGSSAVILYLYNQDKINKKLCKLKQEGMLKLKKVKAGFES